MSSFDHPVLYVVFIGSFLAGMITVFTPYVYNMVPITLQNINIPKADAATNRFIRIKYCGSIVLVHTLLGMMVSLILDQKKWISHIPSWIIYLFFFRLFAGLGISFLGAFDLNLPKRWKRKTHAKVTDNSQHIFLMALRLPVVSFSSTAPIICLVLLLSGKNGVAGTTVGMAGFSFGLILPFIYPGFINILPPQLLNYIKVFLGFFAIIISLKFLSDCDMALGWHIIDRQILIVLLIILSCVAGLYMLGKLKFANDYLQTYNHFGVEYIPIVRLIISIIAFTFAVYVLPGLWGAPLHGLQRFLPAVHP